ncbi:MAG: hypothetical protein MJ239_03715 [Bacilli bacterium]|nr:hypothetical protein [Bacilli bacterium]
MNKKKMILLAVPFVAMALSSCADADPANIFGGDEYISNFRTNVYSVWEGNLKSSTTTIDNTYTVDADHRFSGGGPKSEEGFYKRSDYAGYGELRALYPEAVKDDKDPTKTLNWTTLDQEKIFGTDGYVAEPGEWVDQTDWEHKIWSQNKKMSRINPAFKHGVLSKLYDGRTQCNHWNSFAYIQLDQRGYGTIFPSLELDEAKYFAMTFRGGSTYEPGRISWFNINVTFYKWDYSASKFNGTTFAMTDCGVQTNQGANYTALYGFFFEEFGYDPHGIVGMSITYTIEDDNGYSTSSDLSNPKDDEEYLCLMLYEVTFPDSKWITL